jgi:hypothetical protein
MAKKWPVGENLGSRAGLTVRTLARLRRPGIACGEAGERLRSTWREAGEGSENGSEKGSEKVPDFRRARARENRAFFFPDFGRAPKVLFFTFLGNRP